MTEPVLICTDLDRTLIPNGHYPESANARPLFRKIVARDDVFLVYVSGRDQVLLEEAIIEWKLPLPDYAIGDVGTSIYTVHNGNWELLESWRNVISRDWGSYQRGDIAQWLAGIDILTSQEESKQNDFKLSYYAPVGVTVPALLEDIHQRLNKHPIRYNVIWSIDDTKQIGLLDILPQRANKLQAIHFLMQQHSFDSANTVFSGDSGNDLEVLCSDIRATLVHNASYAIKQQARQLADEKGYADRLYIAQGGFLGMNGNYAAGILEGLAHYIPQTLGWMTESSN
ncbi:HAD-IIB family hydrolase [Thiohalophilus sp.]|uniref:HAD-IIB family hydrolase n=1 Tax=Thiohalophilus sp. TaxID=3028392 RepID=UPI002ACE69A3|nr:HAD-IIB family hydrolase [Thiohalophilus sp.]MDZ7662668.1 HAD-IIB family hydrolase [Thiohalophilus sp.]